MFDNNNDNEIVMMAETAVSQKTEKMVEYIRSLKTLEDAMEPYKEQKRDLKANYVENNWLTKGEISLAVKAYRLAKDDTDMGQLIDMVATLKTKGVGQ